MLYCRVVCLLAILLFVPHASAQTPRAALEHFKNGNKKLENGELGAAIEELSRAIEISSRLEVSRSASRSAQTNGFAHAEGDASGITVIDPLTAHAYTSRGLARYGQGDVDGAILDWNRAIAINPGLAAAYLDRASARYRKGDLAGALADLERALSINPRMAGAYSNRGAIRREQGETDKALADLNRAIALEAGNPGAHCHRGFARIDKHDWQ